MSATEIAKESSIPRPSVYEILRNFAKRGICNEIQEPNKLFYEIIDSNVLKDKFENDIRNNFELSLNNLNSLFHEIKPLYKSKKRSEFKSDVELIKGFNRLREQKFLDLVKKSKHAILVMNRLDGVVTDDLNDESKNFFKRGGKIKSIYETSGNFKIKINDRIQKVTKEGLIRICESFAKYGEEVRLLEQVPQVMAIFDHKTVFISLFDESMKRSERTDMIIHNRMYAALMTVAFEHFWKQANTLEKLKAELKKSLL
jgi:sugar-specific transcriptional regulator TrmB